MSDSTSAETWLNHQFAFDQNLEFCYSGGSLIRFVAVDSETTHKQFLSLVDDFSKNSNFRFIKMKAPEISPHKPELAINSLINEMRENGELKTLLDSTCRKVWETAGYFVSEHESFELVRVAAKFGIEAKFLREDFLRALTTLFRGKTLNIDFVNGLQFAVKKYVLEGSLEFYNYFTMWLTGEDSFTERKAMLIQWKIRASNSASVLRSILSWQTLASYEGVILHLDLRWYTTKRANQILSSTNVAKGTEFYNRFDRYSTRAQREPLYQWLRSLIDQIGNSVSLIVFAEFTSGFLDTSRDGIGMGSYPALMDRILSDTNAVGVPNLSNTLIRFN
jgi:hypothetical protein